MLPVLFLPGMMCDARLFALQLAALSAWHPVMVGNLTGADSMAALARQVLDAAPPRFALAGLSMGGIVAMEVLAQAPERVAAVALIDTNHLAERPETQAARAGQIAQVQAGGLDRVMAGMIARYATSPATAALCRDMAAALGPTVFVRQSVALRDRRDYAAVLQAVRCRALVLCGAQDGLCPPARHAAIADLIPGARCAVIGAAGHLSVLDQPEQVTWHLEDWLRLAAD